MEFPECVKKHRYFTPFKYSCQVCRHKTVLYTHSEMEHHLKWQSHKENMERFYCKSCELHCYKQTAYSKHLETKGHKQKTGELPMHEHVDLKCEICDVKFISRCDKQRHLETNKHKQRAGIIPKPNLTCETCGVTAKCARAMEIHNQTRKHQAKTHESRASEASLSI
jgi:hypothetical protein